ncbi:MlaD family protein [Gloeothece citriformis]
MLQSAVGLTILVALGLLGWLILWLSNFSFGNRSYRATFIFPNAGGMSVGTRVAYRGVRVGRIVSINPEPGGVAIGVEISPADRLIPANSSIEAVQAGLVGETSIDIIPVEGLPPEGVKADPLDPKCNRAIIICNGSRLQGEGKLDVNALIRSLLRIADVIDDPEFTGTVRVIAQRTTDALGNISSFSKEASGLIKDTRSNRTINRLDNTLLSIDQAADSVNQAASQIDQVTGDINQAAGSLQRLGNQASSLLEEAERQDTLKNLNSTLVSLQGFSEQIRGFITVNQGNIGNTLVGLGETSQELAATLRKLGPILTQVEQSKLVTNLDTISNNTAALTGNLRDISAKLNDPATIVQLQQILDAARAVFENANKITSDLDELTGNPQFRRDLRRVIEGLSNLVSSSEQLQQQLEYAQVLNRVEAEVNRIQSRENISLKPKNVTPTPIKPKNITPSQP